MIEQIAYLVVAVILIFLNAFFVMAEFALVKARATRLKVLADSGNPRAKASLEIINKLDHYLASNQVGITVATLGLGWIGEPVFARLFESIIGHPPWLSPGVSHTLSAVSAFLFVTFMVLILGEQVPKIIAVRKAERAVLATTNVMKIFHIIFYVPLWIVNGCTNLILKLIKIPPVNELELAHGEEELKLILAASHEKGAFTLSRLLMMENVLDFGELSVRDVMIPWQKVICLSEELPWSETQQIMSKVYHSRYPVMSSSGEVTGLLHVKDVVKKLGETPEVSKLKRPIGFVQESLSCEELLRKFLNMHSHMFLVRDGSGGLTGLVTLEDVLEELVGPIRDEFEGRRVLSLTQLCPKDAIILDIGSEPKEFVIKKLVERLAVVDNGVNLNGVFDSIIKRERIASTGLGEGIALSHARVDGLKKALCAIGQSKVGVDYNSMDGRPVNIIFLLLSPTHDEGSHIMILERISTLLSSDYLKSRLENAKTVDDVVEILRVSDSSILA